MTFKGPGKTDTCSRFYNQNIIINTIYINTLYITKIINIFITKKYNKNIQKQN